jgi:hypothetical protein
VHFAGKLVRLRALKRYAHGAQWELWIESAFGIEADLTRKDGAVTEAPSRLEGRGIEPGRSPPEAKRIIRVA